MCRVSMYQSFYKKNWVKFLFVFGKYGAIYSEVFSSVRNSCGRWALSVLFLCLWPLTAKGDSATPQVVGELSQEKFLGDKHLPEKPTVNILTWWGYFDDPSLKNMLEKKCNVKISCDVYYSIAEFLRRWAGEKQNYDIIIFSGTAYQMIKNGLDRPAANLQFITERYHPLVKQRYEDRKYLPNVVYFFCSVAGLLWNPKIISIKPDDDLITLFRKAESNIVVLLDEPAEVRELIFRGLGNLKGDSYKTKNDLLAIERINSLAQNSQLFITNDYLQMSKSINFAFSFTWSGEAIEYKIANPNYQFLIHPQLSYLTADLLAVLNKKSYVVDVVKTLFDDDVTRLIQNDNFYFSPSFDMKGLSNPIFCQVYQDVIKRLPTLPWIGSVTAEDYDEFSYKWKMIHLALASRKGTNEINHSMADSGCSTLSDFMLEEYDKKSREAASARRLLGDNILDGKRMLVIGVSSLFKQIPNFLEKKDMDITVADMDSAALKKIERRMRQHAQFQDRFHICLIPSTGVLFLDSSSFDVVCGRDIPLAQWNVEKLFEEVKRVLKKEGLFLLEGWTRSKASETEVLRFVKLLTLDPSLLETKNVKLYLERAGFKRINSVDVSNALNESIEKHLDHLEGRYSHQIKEKFGEKNYQENITKLRYCKESLRQENFRALRWEATK